MLKPNHISYLRLADSVLDNLNIPYKSYTLSYKELFEKINSDVPYEKSYSNQLEKFLLEGFDTNIEVASKAVLFNSILLFLKDENLIHYDNEKVQISYKGILKVLYGFEDDYNKAKRDAEQAKKQQKFENFMKILPVIVAIVGIIVGHILSKN